MEDDILSQSPGPTDGIVTYRISMDSGVPAEASAASGPETDGPLFEPRPRFAGRKILVAAILGVGLALGGIALFVALKGGNSLRASNGTSRGEVDHPAAAVLPVNTVRPRHKTLQRTLEQPGSIQPWAQAELYAKASGYLLSIQRIPTPQMIADVVLQGRSGCGSPLIGTAQLSTAVVAAFRRAPQIDIGASVSAGEVLMEIAAPEKHQEIIEKETLVRQRSAELEAAKTALATFEAAVLTAKAQKKQAEADVRRYASEYTFRMKEWKRYKDLVESRTVIQEVADEKENQASAALAAWESSQAKVQTAEAELTAISSKLATAQADIRVKETLVQTAKDSLRLAILVEDYNRIYAPFDGVITYRGVDEGDFIQNATSGQARRLMTVTALDKVKVVVQVPDRDAPWVRLGTEAVIVAANRSGKTIRGNVTRMANALDSQTRTMQVEIDLDNRDRELLPGMYGKVILVLQNIPNAQAIPATAVYSRKGENFILQVRDGQAHRQRVRIRYDDGKEMEVVKLIGGQQVPLDAQDELIVSNKGEIADGQRVKATLINPGAVSGGAGKEAKHDKKQQSRAPAPAALSDDAAHHAVWLDRLPSPVVGPAAGGDSARASHRL